MKEIVVNRLEESPNIFISNEVGLMMRSRYGGKYFPEETKKAVDSLINNIELRSIDESEKNGLFCQRRNICEKIDN